MWSEYENTIDHCADFKIRMAVLDQRTALGPIDRQVIRTEES
jgi:hypothetical protein